MIAAGHCVGKAKNLKKRRLLPRIEEICPITTEDCRHGGYIQKSRSKKPKTKPRFTLKENLSSNTSRTIPILLMIRYCCFAWICKINCQLRFNRIRWCPLLRSFACWHAPLHLLEMRKNLNPLVRRKPCRFGRRSLQVVRRCKIEIFAGHNETTVEEYGERVQNACSFMK